jgi:hypothetical protein
LVAVANRKKEAKQARLDARAEQIRKKAEREARTRNIIIGVFAFLIIGGAAGLYLVTNPPAFLTGNSVASSSTGSAFDVADEGHEHVPDGSKVSYKHQPPSSGNHYNSKLGPLPWSPYKEPVQPESFVHNLEHGGIVLVYKCSGSECDDMFKQASDVFAKLPKRKEPAKPQQGQQQISEVKFLSTPYQEMQPKVAALAWNKEEDMSSIDLTAITAFYNQFVDHGREDAP